MSQRALAVLLLTLATVACSKKEPAVTPTPTDPTVRTGTNPDSVDAAARAAAAAEAARLERERLAALERARAALMGQLTDMIHFDYDQFSIRPEDQEKLRQKAAIMRANASLRIRVVGHADDRGSDEYNLALSMRRAVSAKEFLVGQGIDAGRIEAASLGEERPMDTGANESAWAMNRRDEFEVIAGGQNLMPPGN